MFLGLLHGRVSAGALFFICSKIIYNFTIYFGGVYPLAKKSFPLMKKSKIKKSELSVPMAHSLE